MQIMMSWSIFSIDNQMTVMKIGFPIICWSDENLFVFICIPAPSSHLITCSLADDWGATDGMCGAEVAPASASAAQHRSPDRW